VLDGNPHDANCPLTGAVLTLTEAVFDGKNATNDGKNNTGTVLDGTEFVKVALLINYSKLHKLF
jgi:hypothetical protein